MQARKDHWPAHTAFLDEFCDCLEEQFFPGLPVIVRHQGRGQPELLKGSTGRRGEITVRGRR